MTETQQHFSNPTITTKFIYSDSFPHQRIFKQPLFLIGSFLKVQYPSYLFTHLQPTILGNTLIEWEGQFFRAFKKMNGYALNVLDNPNQAKV